jgi:hypothetical protein
MKTLIKSNRDLRIDFFRGIALWCMFIDHLISGFLRLITLMRYGFCDSAELFVLLSGVSAGLVYCGAAARKDRRAAQLRVLSRVVTLYRTQLIMLVLFLAEAGVVFTWLKAPGFLEFNNLEGFNAAPFQFLLDGVLLHYQPRYLNILPLYIVFLFVLAVGMPLVLRWPRAVLSVSCALYVATRLFHLSLPGWNGYFNPLAWQIIFFSGVVAHSVFSGKRHWRGWDVLAAGFVLFGLFESQAAHLARLIPAPVWLHLDIDKSRLHPLRLLSILSYSWLGWRFIPASAAWLRSRWADPFVLLGQHSLPVFVTSAFLAMVGQAWLATHSGLASQVVVQAAGSVALLLLAAGCAINNRKPRASVRVVVPQTEAAPTSFAAEAETRQPAEVSGGRSCEQFFPLPQTEAAPTNFAAEAETRQPAEVSG